MSRDDREQHLRSHGGKLKRALGGSHRPRDTLSKTPAGHDAFPYVRSMQAQRIPQISSQSGPMPWSKRAASTTLGVTESTFKPVIAKIPLAAVPLSQKKRKHDSPQGDHDTLVTTAQGAIEHKRPKLTDNVYEITEKTLPSRRLHLESGAAERHRAPRDGMTVMMPSDQPPSQALRRPQTATGNQHRAVPRDSNSSSLPTTKLKQTARDRMRSDFAQSEQDELAGGPTISSNQPTRRPRSPIVQPSRIRATQFSSPSKSSPARVPKFASHPNLPALSNRDRYARQRASTMLGELTSSAKPYRVRKEQQSMEADLSDGNMSLEVSSPPASHRTQKRLHSSTEPSNDHHSPEANVKSPDYAQLQARRDLSDDALMESPVTARRPKRFVRKSARSSLPLIPTPPPPSPVRWSKTVPLKPWKHPVVFPPGNAVRRATVDFNDLERLDEGEFLNDSIIGYGLRRIEANLKPDSPKIHFFSTFFYSALTSGARKFNYEAVKKWTKNKDLLSIPFIVVPINYDLHWFTAIICNLPKLLERAEDADEDEIVLVPDSQKMQDLSLEEDKAHAKDKDKDSDKNKPTVIILDSLGLPRSPEIKILKDYCIAEARNTHGLELDRSMFKGVMAKGLPQQSNYCDCGVFVVAYLEAFVEDPYGFVDEILTRSQLKHRFIKSSQDSAPAEDRFRDFTAANKRSEIRDQLLQLYEVQDAPELDLDMSESVIEARDASDELQVQESQQLMVEEEEAAEQADDEMQAHSPAKSDLNEAPLPSPNPKGSAMERRAAIRKAGRDSKDRRETKAKSGGSVRDFIRDSIEDHPGKPAFFSKKRNTVIID